MTYIGIDLGGTKIEIVAMDESGSELTRRRVPTPQGDYDETLRTICDLVKGVERELGVQASIGIGTPGALSTSGVMKNANSTCLIGRPLPADLEKRLNRPVRMANDANCFALSEAVDGAGKGAKVVFGVILGTGVGGGIVANGQLLIGRNAIGGEWGHNPLPWPLDAERPGPPCYCGKSGCIETFLSGPGMARDHFLQTGESLTPEAIEEGDRAHNVACIQTLARYEDRLARSCAHVINIVDPDIIVLGGGMSRIERLYGDIPRIWGDYVFSDCVETELSPAHHGDSSGVRGAAWLWKEKS